MATRHSVKGWEEFEKLVTSLESQKKPINVFFTGNKDELGERYVLHTSIICIHTMSKH